MRGATSAARKGVCNGKVSNVVGGKPEARRFLGDVTERVLNARGLCKRRQGDQQKADCRKYVSAVHVSGGLSGEVKM